MFHLGKFDFLLFLPAIFLLFFGGIIIASITPESLANHLIYIFLSLAIFFLFSFFDLETLFPLAPILYIAGIFFLILPFTFGTVTRGAIRWIPIGGLTIQPSEVVKPFVALFSAWYWSSKKFAFKNLLRFLLLLSPSLLLIFLQPDLGSTLVVLSILAGVVLVSGIELKEILILILAVAVILPIFWFSLRDYQKLRVIHFIDPFSDPLGQGYNLIQAKIAVGSGGFLGRGLGRGTQSHLAFLPEKHTDFILASLAEETGLWGSSLVLFFYFFLFWRILKICSRLENRNYFLLSLALFFGLFFQTVVNIGMNVGLLPITGVTLPLVSSGGSSLFSTMISLGILEAISAKAFKQKTIEIK